MRIWDVSPEKLCRNHLLGEHRELHAIWSILTKNKKGYSRHPETVRWKSSLGALYLRHGRLAREMKRRHYRHNSDLEKGLAAGSRKQRIFIDSRKKQREILKRKGCGCNI